MNGANSSEHRWVVWTLKRLSAWARAAFLLMIKSESILLLFLSFPHTCISTRLLHHPIRIPAEKTMQIMWWKWFSSAVRDNLNIVQHLQQKFDIIFPISIQACDSLKCSKLSLSLCKILNIFSICFCTEWWIWNEYICIMLRLRKNGFLFTLSPSWSSCATYTVCYWCREREKHVCFHKIFAIFTIFVFFFCRDDETLMTDEKAQQQK